ncbi:hypothetical protein [Maricaulis sp.]|uniref:hypothetical protein n=1 Tax=Maricaulis sp. TaxID=1486257 RepID=UPI003A937463
MTSHIRIAKSLPASGLLLAAALLVSCGGEDGADAATVAETAMSADTVADITQAAAPAADQATAPAVDMDNSQAAEPAYVGTWGVDLAQCAVGQEYEQPPMILRADGYDQHEAHCDFDSVSETGPAQWHISGHCSVEGDKQTVEYNLAIVDGQLEQWSGDDREYVWTLVRCPG